MVAQSVGAWYICRHLKLNRKRKKFQFSEELTDCVNNQEVSLSLMTRIWMANGCEEKNSLLLNTAVGEAVFHLQNARLKC